MFIKKKLVKLITILIVTMMFIAAVPIENFAFASSKESDAPHDASLEKIELYEDRTQTSKTFNNLDGTLTTEIYESPIHFQDPQGKWKNINNELKKVTNNGKGQFKNTANDFSVTFDEEINSQDMNLTIQEDTNGIEIGLTEVTFDTDISPIQEVSGVVVENQIHYKDILENVSTIYSVGDSFVKEDIVLDEKPSEGLPRMFTYQLSLDNLTYEQVGGQVYLKDSKTGETVYLIEAPFMYDSYVPKGFEKADLITSVPEEAKSYDLDLSLREEGGQLFLDLQPDLEWLEDTDRIYPIVIDPTIVRLNGMSQMEDTTIRSGFPAQTGGNDWELGVGTSADGNTVRSLLDFDMSAIHPASTLISAELNLYLSSTNNANPIDVSIHKVNKPWIENVSNWRYYTSALLWATPGGDYQATAMATLRNVGAVPSNIQNGQFRVNLPLTQVKEWIANPTLNHGMLIRGTAETTKIYKKFISSENTTAADYQPKMVITYKTPNRLGLESYWDYASHNLTNGLNQVNLGTNNNIIQYTDFSLLNYGGFGLDFTRTYNSKDYERSDFGTGWSFNGSEKLYISPTEINYKDSDGTDHFFNWNGIRYVPPVGNYDKLEKITNSLYRMTASNGHTTLYTVKEDTADTAIKVAYITEQSDLNGNKITYAYNTKNQLSSITTNLGTSLLFTYNGEGYISKIQNDSQEVNYSYTGQHLTRVATKKDATEFTFTHFTYGTNGQLTQVTDSEGHIMNYEYNSSMDLISVTEPALEMQKPSKTVYSLDRPNFTMRVTSPEGDVTTYQLNANFVVTRITAPSGEVTTYTMDNNYNVLSETNQNTNYGMTYTYDTKGNLLDQVDTKDARESYTYDSLGNVLTHTDAANNVSTNTYDTKGNLITSISPKNEKTSYVYNTRGDLIEVTYPSGNKDTYDVNYLNKQKTTRHTDVSLGVTTESVHDLRGNLLSYTDGKNQKTTYQYNLKDELTAVTDAKGNSTSYTYDKNGNLEAVRTPLADQMTLEYNSQNAVSQETNALGHSTNYEYNADGVLTKMIKASGTNISYIQNEEQQSTITTVNARPQYSVQKKELSTTVTNHTLSDARTIYTESESGNLEMVEHSLPKNNPILYAYNASDMVNQMSYAGASLLYDYDANGQLSSVMNEGKQVAAFTYNVNGLITDTQLGFGGSIKNSYSSDGTLLQKQSLQTGPTTLWDEVQYEYDANRQITRILDRTGSVEYTYDALNQLTKEHYSNGLVISYTYDSVGNRISKSVTRHGVTTPTNYGFNLANQMVNVNGQPISNSMDGNQTMDGRHQYIWNAFDQLTQVKSLTGAVIATYKYDEQGRRVYSEDSNGTTYYRYDGSSNRVLFEEDALGNITKSYTYDGNGTPLTMTYSGQTYYYLTNYRGDVLALVDANGNVAAEYSYDAWGNILTQSGHLASINPYRYAGYRYDEQTKLYYLMARYYNPDLGMFLSLDPVRGDTMNPITMNGYNYANNNPVMMVDPDGMAAVSSNVRRASYALFTGLAYIVLYLYNDVKSIITAINGIYAIVKAYKTTRNMNMASTPVEAMKRAHDDPNYFKNVRKGVVKVALRAGLRALLTLSAWSMAAIIAIGMYKGWAHYNKFKNYGMVDFSRTIYRNYKMW